MKIVILLPKMHAGAELALNKLIRRPDLEIIGLIRSDISVFSKKYWKYMRYGVRRAGLFYAIVIGLMVYFEFIGVALAGLFYWHRKRSWRTSSKLVQIHNLKLHDTDNINSKKSIQILKSWKPDVIVSLSFDQILNKKVIEIPKIAALNMHPGLLPKYRGIWPNFWKLHNREKYAGVTIHHIAEEVDAGEIIAQMKFPIKEKDSKVSLYLKSAHHGSKLLAKTLAKMKQGVKIKPLKIKGKPKYYSLPNKKQFAAFFARGKKLFNLCLIWKKFGRKV